MMEVICFTFCCISDHLTLLAVQLARRLARLNVVQSAADFSSRAFGFNPGLVSDCYLWSTNIHTGSGLTRSSYDMLSLIMNKTSVLVFMSAISQV